MEDLEGMVAALRLRSTEREREHMHAQVVRQQAEQALEQATAALRDELGVSPEEVPGLADSLERRARYLAAEVSSALDGR